MIKSRVLFLCSGNSCRTQMAEALLRDLAADRFHVVSAGANPTQLDPEAVEAMRELGLDISGNTPKDVSGFLGERFTHVISLCDRQRERTCPIFPGAIWRDQWDIENPALSPDHSAAGRRVRDQLRQRIVQFVSENQ